MSFVGLINGSAGRIPLKDGSVHCCATSPPYFGLRAYAGEQGQEWPTVEYAPMPGLPPIRIQGCEPSCEHVWGVVQPGHHPGQVEQTKWKTAKAAGHGQTAGSGQFCQRCGGWRGPLGLEPAPEMYVAHIVLIFREVRRVLHESGTVWLNLGDSFSSIGHKKSNSGYGTTGLAGGIAQKHSILRHENNGPGLKHKDKIGVPHRTVLALQADGWWWRSAPPWLKRNAMPESVTDRPSTANEEIFMLTKSERYFYDKYAVLVPFADERQGRDGSLLDSVRNRGGRTDGFTKPNGIDPSANGGRNRRTTDWYFESLDIAIAETERWLRHAKDVRDNGGMLVDESGDPLALLVNPRGYPGAHYAVFPEDLVRPMILASTSERGVCPACNAPWERVVERDVLPPPDRINNNGFKHDSMTTHGEGAATLRNVVVQNTLGWQPTCGCHVDPEGNEREPLPPVPATVLDPFCGSGTTLLVARQLGRSAIGLDISQPYLAEQVRSRLGLAQLDAWQQGSGRVVDEPAFETLPLFAALGND